MADDAEELIRAHTRSREDFLTLAEAMPNLVWMAAPDGTITYFNQRWVEFTGVDTESLVGQRGTGLVHPDDLERTWSRWKRALTDRTLFETEYRLRRRSDGLYRWFIARACPILEPDGSLSRWIGTATDIDAQRRTTDSLRFVLDCANDLAKYRDVPQICDRLASLATQRFADWCFVALANEDRRYTIESVSHKDPARVRAVQAYLDRHPIRESAGISSAITEKRSTLASNIAPDLIIASATDDEHRDVLESLRIRSVLVVPIVASDAPALGALALISSESERMFDEADMAVAEIVARQAGTTLANARAFEQERQTSKLLRFVARATQHLTETFDVSRAMKSVLDLAVQDVADVAYIWEAQRGAMRIGAAAAREGIAFEAFQRLIGERPMRPQGEALLFERIAREPYILGPWPDDSLSRATFYEFAYDAFASLAIRSVLVLPLRQSGIPSGALVFLRCNDSPIFTENDREILAELARHASLAYGQAELFARERRIATELQRAMLPRPDMLPKAPGITFDVVYRPSALEAQVGGDWYDAFELPDASLVVSVGDVTGRGLGAAGLMGKLRQAIGVIALYESDPARILDTADLLLRQRGSNAIATAFLGILDPQRRAMRYANAGHPPPFLRRAGAIEALESQGLPLGLRDQWRAESATVSLDRAELLVLYTDGLIESTRNLLEGESTLRDVLARGAVMHITSPAAMLCDACLPPDAPDDVAVLTLTFSHHHTWSFDAENARAAHDARSDFMEYLRSAGAAGDFSAAELIFGELIGNVVRHAPGPIDVHIEWEADRPILHVTDRGAGFDRKPALPEDVMKESGRGLFIVEAFSAGMRVEYVPGFGSHVCVELPLRASARASAPRRVG